MFSDCPTFLHLRIVPHGNASGNPCNHESKRRVKTPILCRPNVRQVQATPCERKAGPHLACCRCRSKRACEHAVKRPSAQAPIHGKRRPERQHGAATSSAPNYPTSLFVCCQSEKNVASGSILTKFNSRRLPTNEKRKAHMFECGPCASIELGGPPEMVLLIRARRSCFAASL